MKLKRILAGALAVACVSSINVFAADTASKTGFSDVNESTAEGQAIVKMYEAGYIKGYEDGTFKPNGNITRAELTRVFNQVFGYKADEEKLKSVKNFAEQTNDLITQISQASATQSEAVHQVTAGIDQISGVVQMNSATAEQSAASCETLSSMSRELKNQISKLKA